MLGGLGFCGMLSLWRSARVFTLSHPWPFADDWFGVRTSNFAEGLFRGNINPEVMSVPLKCSYDIEDQIKTAGDDDRLIRRETLSRHVLDQIAAYLDSEAMASPKVLPKSNLGMAAAYVRRHWDALCRFTRDATIPIDNNDCEQLMKTSAPDCAA